MASIRPRGASGLITILAAGQPRTGRRDPAASTAVRIGQGGERAVAGDILPRYNPTPSSALPRGKGPRGANQNVTRRAVGLSRMFGGSSREMIAGLRERAAGTSLFGRGQ